MPGETPQTQVPTTNPKQRTTPPTTTPKLGGPLNSLKLTSGLVPKGNGPGPKGGAQR